MALRIYNRIDYERIKKEGFTFTLPAETLAAIRSIATNVGAPEYIKTPHFEKRGNTIKMRIPVKEISNAEWDTLRSFKATILEKKQGVDLSIDKIRKHLNKCTNKTYESLKVQIMAEIDFILKETLENPDLVSELTKIGAAIFEIASGNSFYSGMYATLYNELMKKYDFMRSIFTTNLNTETNIFKDFEYCDPNKDYDKFCKNNKTNEKRRALSLFYVNLMLQGIIPVEKIRQMLDDVQADLIQYIKKENCVNIVEEISELVYIIIINGAPKLKEMEDDEWEQIGDKVNLISAMKVKSEPSISNKTIFKHMDIQSFMQTC